MVQPKKNRRPDTKWLEAKGRIWEYIPDENEEALQPFAIRLDLYSFRFDLMMGENSFRKPSFTTFARICEALNANPTYLLFGKGAKYLDQIVPHATFQELADYCVDYFLRLDPADANEVVQEFYQQVKRRVNDAKKHRAIPAVSKDTGRDGKGLAEKSVPRIDEGSGSDSGRKGPKRKTR